jgi:hypothetical protein
MKETALVDRVYVLKKRNTPLSYMLTSKNTSRSPLYYFDGKSNRPLRYARNQKSPFEDEQDGSAILEPIVFVDGALNVPKTNPVLQKFLEYHPGNGKIFEEVNTERDASAQFEKLTTELDAQLAARELSLDMLEAVARVLLGGKIDKMSTAELKRDVLVYARTYPEKFMEMLNDPMLTLQNTCAKFFDQDLLKLKNRGKDIYFNLETNKKKILTVPYGENYLYILASHLKSDDGIETLRLLESHLD